MRAQTGRCADCAHWRSGDSRWGDCLCPDYMMTWVPLSQHPGKYSMFKGTLVEWNDTMRPKDPTYLTNASYVCPRHLPRV